MMTIYEKVKESSLKPSDFYGFCDFRVTEEAKEADGEKIPSTTGVYFSIILVFKGRQITMGILKRIKKAGP